VLLVVGDRHARRMRRIRRNSSPGAVLNLDPRKVTRTRSPALESSASPARVLGRFASTDFAALIPRDSRSVTTRTCAFAPSNRVSSPQGPHPCSAIRTPSSLTRMTPSNVSTQPEQLDRQEQKVHRRLIKGLSMYVSLLTFMTILGTRRRPIGLDDRRGYIDYSAGSFSANISFQAENASSILSPIQGFVVKPVLKHFE